MHPTTSHMQARLHTEELHRQAAAHRAVAAHRAATVRHRPTLRTRAGALLVQFGSRLQGRSPTVAGPRAATSAGTQPGSPAGATANGTC